MTPDLLLSYYGDDLTGSTDVMEALSSRGVPTVLFLAEPDPAFVARLPPAMAFGLAGTSRSETPAWMDAHLPPAFGWLRSLRAPVCHYKVCSTFDSSPAIGSIGKALDIGADLFGQRTVPLVVGAPQLRRYTAFGTLFAGYRDEVFRIDRHPVMSRHPVTPMAEADLRVHLARQTARSMALADLALLGGADAQERIEAILRTGPGVLMLDVIDSATQRAAGEALWRQRRGGGMFVVGSSGVEYALLAHWAASGMVAGAASFVPPGAAERIAVVSGSCSAVTEAQIRYATARGFAGIAVDPHALIAGDEARMTELIELGLAPLRQGRSVILYTALGPGTDLGAELAGMGDARHAIGRGLGKILRALVQREGLTRAVVAGGDTSSHALHELEIAALTTCLPLPQTPGSPLCTGHSPLAAFDGLQVALKGGQIGRDDYFLQIARGSPESAA